MFLTNKTLPRTYAGERFAVGAEEVRKESNWLLIRNARQGITATCPSTHWREAEFLS